MQYPEAEVIALSPRTLLATNRFVCEICGKGFQRDQNLQLHRRGHNLPWKLRQRTSKEPRKRVYVCPERSCVHHHPSRALGDLTGIKKHFCRKHGEKKWKCERCAKRYAVQSDWKAHSKTCGTREYRCDCGTIFSRRDSFITHRAFCDALALETARVAAASNMSSLTSISDGSFYFTGGIMRSNMLQSFPNSILKPSDDSEMVNEQARPGLSLWMGSQGVPHQNLSENLGILNSHQSKSPSIIAYQLHGNPLFSYRNLDQNQSSWMDQSKLSSSTSSLPSLYSTQQHQEMVIGQDMSATGLLQKAAQIGVTSASCPSTLLTGMEMKCNSNDVQYLDKYDAGGFLHSSLAMEKAVDTFSLQQNYMAHKGDGRGGETRDFLGVDAPSICASTLNGWI
ncbi:zinc finger protein NUTCRACKER-like [Canna indica]|uniref:Protein EARLY HEADING DATE 2 n=1 Tax=Canna indica TaxID=4628 RepID=A0AAQ3KTS3_9LILI|nr:zinc finger protein NUTCRACKER-like [Canna indica]